MGAKSTFDAEGCGKRGTYVVHCMAGGGCRAYSEADWAKREARNSATSVAYSVTNECRNPVDQHDAGNDNTFRLKLGEKRLLTGKVGDELRLTDDAGA